MKLWPCECTHSWFSIMPLQYTSMAPNFDHKCDHRIDDRIYYNLHLRDKMNVNGPKFIELWLGEVWYYNDVLSTQT